MVGWTCKAVVAQQPCRSDAVGSSKSYEGVGATEVCSRCIYASQLCAPRRCWKECWLVDAKGFECRILASNESKWRTVEWAFKAAENLNEEGERSVSEAFGFIEANSRFLRSCWWSSSGEWNFDRILDDHVAYAKKLNWIFCDTEPNSISFNCFLCHHVCVKNWIFHLNF